MFIPLIMVSIGIDPYPYKRVQCFIHEAQASNVQVLFWLMASSASPSVKLGEALGIDGKSVMIHQ